MGYRQHLLRSILAIREQGGVPLGRWRPGAGRAAAVGRSEAKLGELADLHDLAD